MLDGEAAFEGLERFLDTPTAMVEGGEFLSRIAFAVEQRSGKAFGLARGQGDADQAQAERAQHQGIAVAVGFACCGSRNGDVDNGFWLGGAVTEVFQRSEIKGIGPKAEVAALLQHPGEQPVGGESPIEARQVVLSDLGV